MKYELIKHTNSSGVWYKIYRDGGIHEVYMDESDARNMFMVLKSANVEEKLVLDSFDTNNNTEKEFQCPKCATRFPESLGKVLF